MRSMEHLRDLFIIVGAPPARDKTIVLGMIGHQKSADEAVRTYVAQSRPDTPKGEGWLIRAVPMYPIPAMESAIAQFFIDSGQPPGPGIINPLVRHFQQEVYEAVHRSLFDLPPLAESKWGKRKL